MKYGNNSNFYLINNMSRIGKKLIDIPEKTEVTVSEGFVIVKGPLGENKLAYKPVIEIKISDGKVAVESLGDTLEHRALWGTYASEINSMILGVNKLFQKQLIIEGVGFKSELQGDTLVLNLGFSHPIKMKVPEGINCTVEKNNLTISGIDKEKVGQFAAEIRSNKKPEPYKGKGIRYIDEVVRRKEGKKSV